MNVEILESLISNLTTKLNDIDVFTVECLPFIIGLSKYRDQESLRKDVVKGKVSLFLEIEAILGNDVWEFMEVASEAINSEE